MVGIGFPLLETPFVFPKPDPIYFEEYPLEYLLPGDKNKKRLIRGIKILILKFHSYHPSGKTIDGNALFG